jgi:hypothetical protein
MGNSQDLHLLTPQGHIENQMKKNIWRKLRARRQEACLLLERLSMLPASIHGGGKGHCRASVWRKTGPGPGLSVAREADKGWSTVDYSSPLGTGYHIVSRYFKSKCSI